MIKLIEVTKTIEDFDIVKDINLTINDGTRLGIVGKSGAGKSSLIRIINGLNKTTSGEIFIDGINTTNLNDNGLIDIRRNMGMIFQHFNLLDQKNVYENIRLILKLNNVDKETHEKRVDELLELVGLSSKKYDYPKTLSGGEKQRVAIARALANNPKYLLCDEATSALDKQTSKEILDLLYKINEEFNVTIIFVSHDLDAIKYLCNEVVLMDSAKIIEHKNTIELFTKPENEITKNLISDKIYDLALNSKKDVYQITYIDQARDDALISKLVKKYDVNINILYGEVMDINKKQVGFLYVNIIGKDKHKVIKELEKEVEVIKYV